MDVEFLTDHDTEDALLAWCARRRRVVVPGSFFLFGASMFVLADVGVFWRDPEGLSVALIAAMLFQILAFAIAAIARDPDRPSPLRYPHAELASIGLIILSLVVTFNHQPTLLSLLLLAIALTAFSALAIQGWHAFAAVRDKVPFYGAAHHVHLNEAGIEVTIRPRPQPRPIPWKNVRYMGADNDTFFVVAGLAPVVVPRRAFRTARAWHGFLDAAADYAEAATLKPPRSKPIGKHVRSRKARRTPVAPNPVRARNDARGPRSRDARASGW
jgi:hypothetical protein